MLDAKKIIQLFAEKDIRRSDSRINLNHEYYYGSSVPAELYKNRLDGKQRTPSGYPWIKTVVDTHTGFAMSKAVNIYSEQDQAKKFIKAILAKNSCESLDFEHWKNCCLFGRSYEAISYNDGVYSITGSDPWHWVLIRDEQENVRVAIYRQQMKKNTYYKDQLLESDLDLHVCYTTNKIITIEDGKIVSSVDHVYNDIPVVEYTINKNKDPFIMANIIRMSDNYNISRSTLGDDVKWNTDSLLAVSNANDLEIFTQQIENEEKGTTVFDLLKSIGIFPLPKDAKAEYLSRETDVGKFELDMKSYMDEIYNATYIPNIFKIASGEVSSSALKLLFWPLTMQSLSHWSYFSKALNKRIGLINSIASLVGDPVLSEYELALRVNIPSSTTEVYQYIQDSIPKKHLFRSIDGFFSDPDEAYKDYLEEQKQASSLEKPVINQ
jgi:SPP1 family phage portal protein